MVEKLFIFLLFCIIGHFACQPLDSQLRRLACGLLEMKASKTKSGKSECEEQVAAAAGLFWHIVLLFTLILPLLLGLTYGLTWPESYFQSAK
jgi:hypothetical protein